MEESNNKNGFPYRDKKTKKRVPALFDILSAAVGLAGALFAAFSYIYESYNAKQASEVTLERRIEVLTKSLNQAASSISEIESEVNKRKELVVRLKQDADTAQSLISLNARQAEAVAQLLRREIDRDETKTFWIGAGQNLAFTLFGFGLAEGVAWWRRRRAQRQL